MAGNRTLCAFLLCKSCFIRDTDLCGGVWQLPAASPTRKYVHDRAGKACTAGSCHTPPQRSVSRIKHDLHRRNAQSVRFPANQVCGSRAQRLPGRAYVPMTGHGGHTRLGTGAIGRWRSVSRIKHDLHRRNAQSAHSPAKPACGSRAQRLPGRAHVPMTGHARHTRLGTRLYRSAEVAVLKFRGWRVCARCHRNKKNLRAVLRSGSELVSLSDRILLLVACRPHVCVKRACAVGIARRGAQIGRLRAPCKAGGHC